MAVPGEWVATVGSRLAEDDDRVLLCAHTDRNISLAVVVGFPAVDRHPTVRNHPANSHFNARSELAVFDFYILRVGAANRLNA